MEKTKFRGPYDPVENRPISCSDRYADQFAMVTDDDGHSHLSCIGRRDVYSEIQAARRGTELKEMVSRLGIDAVVATSSSDNLPAENFADVSAAPQDLTELMNEQDAAASRALDAWNNLPADVRNGYKTEKELRAALDDGSLLAALLEYEKKKEVKADA